MRTKSIQLLTLLLCGILFSAQGQVFRVSLYNQSAFVSGDMASTDLSNASAGFVEFAGMAGFEINYYAKNNLGFGLRSSYGFYERDLEEFESAMVGSLGIDGDYDMTQAFGFWSFGGDAGISYLASISEKLDLEPYVYFGFRGLISPSSSTVYQENGETLEHTVKSQGFVGTCISPGVKLHWNFSDHFGLFVQAEYVASSFLEEDERTVTSGPTTLTITDTEKVYNPNSFNIGLGLAFRFGKGLE